MKKTLITVMLTLAGLAGSLTPAVVQAASETCRDKPPPAPQEAALRTGQAKILNDTLAQYDDRIILIARQGQKQDEYGLSFSHAAFAVKAADGHWQAWHNLNSCGTAESDLYIQGMYQFLDDELTSPVVGTVRFTPDMQAKLLAVLNDPQKRRALHNPHYNMVAHPFANDTQNSNGWILMVFAAALSPAVTSVESGTAWLKAEHYIGSSAQAGFLKRALADRFVANISTAGQPITGIVTFHSGDSLIGFVSRYAKPTPDCDHGKFATPVCLVRLPE